MGSTRCRTQSKVWTELSDKRACSKYAYGDCSQQGAGTPQKGAGECEVQSRVWMLLEHKKITQARETNIS